MCILGYQITDWLDLAALRPSPATWSKHRLAIERGLGWLNLAGPQRSGGILQWHCEQSHELNQAAQAVTVAEDVSGMPTLCRPVTEGGVGFDYRCLLNPALRALLKPILCIWAQAGLKSASLSEIPQVRLPAAPLACIQPATVPKDHFVASGWAWDKRPAKRPCLQRA